MPDMKKRSRKRGNMVCARRCSTHKGLRIADCGLRIADFGFIESDNPASLRCLLHEVVHHTINPQSSLSSAASQDFLFGDGAPQSGCAVFTACGECLSIRGEGQAMNEVCVAV